jgi:molecular chaperone DnaJ
MAVAGKRDYYAVLEVERDATPEELKGAFRKLARRWHPDVNPGDGAAEEKFKELNEAYSVLSDPELRQRYDRFGHDAVSGVRPPQDFGFGGLEDLLDLLVGGMGGRGAAPGPRQGADLRADVHITLEEAAFGVERQLTITRLQHCETCEGSGAKPGTRPETCPQCEGTGQVAQVQRTFLGQFRTVAPCARCAGRGQVIREPCGSCGGQGRKRVRSTISAQIPAGVDNGTRVVRRGEGEAGEMGGPSGDLYLFIHVEPHRIFERRGRDLWCEAGLSFSKAALGGVLEAPTLGGPQELAVPAGTQSGDVFLLRGLGLPEPGRGARGDLHVVVRVETPTTLNDRQRKALEEFAAASGEENVGERDEGVLTKLRNLFDSVLGREKE